MAKQARLPGTEGKPVPPPVVETITELKKKKDSTIRAKSAEKKAQDAANLICLNAGYKPGDIVELPDESPPLKFEVKQSEAVVKVRVLNRTKSDETQAGDEN